MNEKSAVEAVAGSTGVNLAVNAAPVLAQVFPAIGAMIDANAVPWLSALPFLLQTLAAGRQSARIDAAITALSADVARLQCDLTNITDDQYKLASECSLAFLSTINPAKLDYLRLAILNTLVDPSIADGASEALARLVRDISAAETALVIDLFSYEGVFIREKLLGGRARLARGVVSWRSYSAWSPACVSVTLEWYSLQMVTSDGKVHRAGTGGAPDLNSSCVLCGDICVFRCREVPRCPS
jgi:hypothetical protein